MFGNLHIRIFKSESLLLPPGTWFGQDVRSSYWRFYWNDSAGGALTLAGGAQYPLQARRIYFVPAWVTFSCENACDVSHFYVHFDVLGIPGIMMREVFNAPIGQDPPEWLARQIDHAAALLPAAPAATLGVQCHIKSILYESLGRYLNSLTREQLERCGVIMQALTPVLPALDYIGDHLGDRISNAFLAGLCHLSDAYFIRQFRASMGLPPGRYILEQRIMTASQRLLFTTQSIEEIADATGFSNRHYFTRIFTEQTGTSPAAFRKARRV